VLIGVGGADCLTGGTGNDTLAGGPSNDRLAGDAGNDTLRGDSGTDRFAGGAGEDTINSRDGRRETVSCGMGRRDRVTADRVDQLVGCEIVRRG
jgi:Ca2+-binding RTX toxin-like protein